MAGDYRTAFARVGSLATLAVCVLFCSQAPRLLSQDIPQGQGKRTLYLLLRIPSNKLDDPKQQEDLILQTIKRGIQRAKLKVREEPIIRTVSPAFVEEIQRLIPGSGWRVEAADDAQAEKNGANGNIQEKLNISLLDANNNIYKIQLPSDKYVLKELDVEFANGKLQTFKLSSPKDKQPVALRPNYPGSYVLRLQGNDVPQKCTATILSSKGEQKLSADWPVQSRAYLLILKDFEGNLDELFAVVQDPDLVGNPIQLLSLDQHLFAVASVGLETEPTSFIHGNTLTVVVPDLKTRRVKHVWVYLPISEEKVDEEIARWLKHSSVKNVSKDLPLLIEKNLVRFDPNQRAILDKDVINQPKWWETGRNGKDHFTRTFELKDIPELVNRIPSMWMLTVWIFEDSDGNKELIFIKNRQGKTAPLESQEIITWRQSLPKLKTKPK
ncbi:MAG: hypothetical protein WHU94_10065 [Thermogemmata sp.]|jgi:hypothetical protein|uniref:Uncharacterized protein n=1 Tax=Thermogemmata fonticola TaxID=2755323 RepID=A0A7V8VGT6_9BACT|nr:hypothetical protein [Thermogemmata fonticola]MBA2227686.1 hypothetical protein [Thermogemmata fonticola]MCX8139270.1 hypothetical protein [Gemmataceae bacterium]